MGLSKEKFFNISAIDHLKIRSSWGILGNDAIGRFNYLALYNFASGYVFDGSLVVGGNSEGTLAAPFTTWEKKETQNLGLEIGLLNRKLFLEFDVFKSITSDILISRNATLTFVSGIGNKLPKENLGEFENNGFEIMATYKESINDFNFNISGNLTYVKNKTIYIDEPEPVPGREHLSREGKPWGTPTMYVVEGRFLTQDQLDNIPALGSPKLGDFIYKDVNEDGIINANDQVISDYSQIPRLVAGLNLYAEYKGVDLTVNTYANAGVKKSIHFYIAGMTNNTPAYYFENLYYSEAEPGNIPALNRMRQRNTFYEKDASFIRLKTVELGYSLPSTILSKIGVAKTRLFINGDNLLTFSKFKDYGLGDPESFVSGGFRFESSFRTITLGLNLSF